MTERLQLEGAWTLGERIGGGGFVKFSRRNLIPGKTLSQSSGSSAISHVRTPSGVTSAPLSQSARTVGGPSWSRCLPEDIDRLGHAVAGSEGGEYFVLCQPRSPSA